MKPLVPSAEVKNEDGHMDILEKLKNQHEEFAEKINKIKAAY